ncbi:unnamed protein product [Ceratitis capitata]|uniref:(Mediterranean fruit fly) hypothetical protein n=1 Tax=Ceratitis capitata TaxID=7213 RepID=A0A811UVY3_CERCA|nr:unnamed protein product [Ceratitis capitata]
MKAKLPTTPTIPPTIPTTPIIPTTIPTTSTIPTTISTTPTIPTTISTTPPIPTSMYIRDPKRIHSTSPLLTKTLQHQMYLDEKGIVPIFEEFSDTEKDKTLEFHIIRFHKSFDGLIGNDIFIPLNACIDYGKKEITIGNKTSYTSKTKT